MDRLIKIILAVLFLVCLIRLPYGFYQLVRFIAFIGFSILAFFAYEKRKVNLMVAYIFLAILFQPVFKILLGRTIWNLIDIVVATWLLTSIFTHNKTHSNGCKVYFFLDGIDKKGPYTKNEMVELKLPQDTLVFYEEINKWVPLSELEDFKEKK